MTSEIRYQQAKRFHHHYSNTLPMRLFTIDSVMAVLADCGIEAKLNKRRSCIKLGNQRLKVCVGYGYVSELGLVESLHEYFLNEPLPVLSLEFIAQYTPRQFGPVMHDHYCNYWKQVIVKLQKVIALEKLVALKG